MNVSNQPNEPQGVLPTPKTASLKERIENNLLVFFFGTILTGFLAGISVYEGVMKMTDYVKVPGSEQRKLKDDLDRKTSEVSMLEAKLKTAQAAPLAQRRMRIRGVEGLDGVRARIVALVNGRAYSYPSHTVWAQLRHGMPTEEFLLPNDVNGYDISFRLLTIEPREAPQSYREFGSQEVIPVKTWPFEGEYKIFATSVGPFGSVTCMERDGKLDCLPARQQGEAIRILFDVR